MTLTIGSIVLASVYFVVAWITKKTSVGFDRKERVLWTAIPLALRERDAILLRSIFSGAAAEPAQPPLSFRWSAHRPRLDPH